MQCLNMFAKSTLALAMVSAANGALAYRPINNEDSDTAAIHWSGASASTITVQSVVIGSICDPDLDGPAFPAIDDDIFRLSRSNFWAIACREDDSGVDPPVSNGTATGPRILVHKRDAGGSGVGVGPIQGWQWIDFQATTAANACGAGGAAVPVASTIAGETVQTVTCGLANVQRRPNVGSSDIEPNKFVINLLNAPANLPHYGCGAAPGAADTGASPFNPVGVALSPQPVAQLLFNTPVNLAFYLALQDAQFEAPDIAGDPDCRPITGLDASVPPRAVPTNPAYSLDSDGDGIIDGNEEECMPSLTAQQIRSIFAARVTDPDNLFDEIGGPALTLQPGYDAARMAVCRRVPGSGSQAVYNVVMHNSVCAATTGPANAAAGPLAGCGGTVGGLAGVCENSSSSDVVNCLEAYHRGTVATSNPAPADRRFAIGILSMESNSINPGGGVFVPPRDFRYIKIDGIAPTLRAAHKGEYYFYGEQTFQNAPAAIPVGCGGASPAPNAAQAAIISRIRSALSTPLRLAEINEGGGPALGNECDHPFHDNEDPVVAYDDLEGCWLGLPTGALVADPVLDLALDPVNVFWRQGDTCQPPIKAIDANAPGMIIIPDLE